MICKFNRRLLNQYVVLKLHIPCKERCLVYFYLKCLDLRKFCKSRSYHFLFKYKSLKSKLRGLSDRLLSAKFVSGQRD
jgi:hypothetical protein